MQVDTFLRHLLGEDHDVAEYLIDNLKTHLKNAAEEKAASQLSEPQLLNHTNAWLKQEIKMGKGSFLKKATTMSSDKTNKRDGVLLACVDALNIVLLDLAEIANKLKQSESANEIIDPIDSATILNIGSSKVDQLLAILKSRETTVRDNTFMIAATSIVVTTVTSAVILAAVNPSAMKTMLTPVTILFHTLAKAVGSNMGGAIISGVIAAAAIGVASALVALSAAGIKRATQKNGYSQLKKSKKEFGDTQTFFDIEASYNTYISKKKKGEKRGNLSSTPAYDSDGNPLTSSFK